MALSTTRTYSCVSTFSLYNSKTKEPRLQRLAITGWPWNPSFHLIDLSFSLVIVANIAIDNAKIVTIQINQIKFDMIGDGK